VNPYAGTLDAPAEAMALHMATPEGPGSGRERRRRAWWLALAAVIVLNGGCAMIRQNEAQYDEDHLVRAGFEREPADTLTQVWPMGALPPLKVLPQTKDGNVVYVYADPYRCGCVYVGDQYAYARYRRLVANDFLDAVLSVSLL
jgi:hypothetical protein